MTSASCTPVSCSNAWGAVDLLSQVVITSHACNLAHVLKQAPCLSHPAWPKVQLQALIRQLCNHPAHEPRQQAFMLQPAVQFLMVELMKSNLGHVCTACIAMAPSQLPVSFHSWATERAQQPRQHKACSSLQCSRLATDLWSGWDLFTANGQAHAHRGATFHARHCFLAVSGTHGVCVYEALSN